LNIQEGIIRIHCAGKHALKFEFFQRFFFVVEFNLDGTDGVDIILFCREFEQLGGIG
jgi:hypothetical protein